MPDETAADDEAMYDVWRRIDPEQVAELFEDLETLARRWFRQRGEPPTPGMVAVAQALRDSGLHLGYLPIVTQVLEAAP